MLRIRKNIFLYVVATVALISATLPVQVPGAGATTEGPETQSQAAGVHQPAIDALDAVEEVDVLADIGCSPRSNHSDRNGDGLCAGDPLTRWEAAVLLVRMVDRKNPPAIVPWQYKSQFDDVNRTDWWAAHVDRAVELDILTGCEAGHTDETAGPPKFCPHSPVSRAQMAALLVNAFDLRPARAETGFIDVPADHEFADDIDRIAAARLTAGCSADPARFCPQRNVTRAETMTLLARAAQLVERPAAPEPYPYRPQHDTTLLPVDPAVRIGTLDNGLTYYLRNNDSPGGSLELRLVVRAGSVHEPAPDLGLAHFLEHMLFNGTEDYPGNSLDAALRDLGLEFGPDVNAGVSYDRTSLTFSLLSSDPEEVDLLFKLLAQMAFKATLNSADVEAERGIVLDELRLATATSAGAIGSEFDRIYTQGTRYEGFRPIGTKAGIESITPQHLKTFYETWYVPSNMAVIAVGDWPVNILQDHLEAHFADEPGGTAPDFPKITYVPDGVASSYVVTDPENTTSYISLDIPIPVHNRSTVGGQRTSLLETLVVAMLNTRLEEAFGRGELSQVDSPNIFAFNHNQGLRYMGTNWRGENLATASTDYLSVLLTAKEHGFTEDDTTRAIESTKATLQSQLDGAETIQDSEYAQRYMTHYVRGSDLSRLEDRHERLTQLLDSVAPTELTQHYRWLLDRSAPIAIAVGPDTSSVPTVGELAAALAAAAAGPPPTETAVVEELMTPPAPVDVVQTRPLTSFNGVEWTFANGSRVLFVPSDIAENRVDVKAVSLGGWSQLQQGDRALVRHALGAVLGSGLGTLTRAELLRFLETRTVTMSANISEASEGFSGNASSSDIETIFQLMHLAVTSPRINNEAYEEAIFGAASIILQAEQLPSWQAWIAYTNARFGGGWFHPVPTEDQFNSLTPAQLLNLYRQRLSTVDDLVVAVVGDVEVEEARHLARHYIGTLPAGEADTYIDRRPPMPTGVLRSDIVVDEGESAVIELNHEWSEPLTPRLRIATELLDTLLEQRLLLEVREQLGETYIATVDLTERFLPQPSIDSTVTVTVDPARLEEIYSTVLSILSDVAVNGASDEEFKQAVTVVKTNYGLVSNNAILDTLTEVHHVEEPRLLNPLRRWQLVDLVTAADVQSLANKLYEQGGRIEIISAPTSAS